MVDAANGSFNSIYKADGYVLILEEYLYDSQTLIFSAVSTPESFNYIFIYHISNASFTQYRFTDNDIDIFGISRSPISGRLVFYGDFDDTSTYVVHTSLDAILDFNGITEDTTQIFNSENNSNYLLTTVSISDPAPTNLTVDNGSTLSSTTRTRNVAVDDSSDLVYYVETPTNSEYSSLVEGWNQTLSINLTCSMSGSTSFEHVIEDYNNYTAPTWISLDDANYQFSVSAPEITSNSDYFFQIRTTRISDSKNYYMAVNLTVLN